jgi:soluble epoxide hydrolase/lipid-phosphate phosphatase
VAGWPSTQQVEQRISSLLGLTHYRGGFVVWRAAQWYPDLITHVFSVCTPYTAPHKVYFSTEDLVKGQLPQFGYQLHLASGEVEKSVKDEQSIRQFLRGLYGARGPNGELVFDPEKGILAENLPVIGESKILKGKVSDISSSSELSRCRSETE